MTDIVIRKPSDCGEGEVNSFEAMVRKGGEVVVEGLRGRIVSAEWLIFLFDEKTLAGVAALKHPNISYKKSVFKKADSDENPDEFIFEVGWIFVEAEFRGKKYSRTLLEATMKLAGNKRVFASTRENNDVMRRTILRYGFGQSGHPYPSEHGDYNLTLFTGPSHRGSAPESGSGPAGELSRQRGKSDD